MSDKLIIDSVEYDVPIIELKRKADILDKTANRSEDGSMHREVIGTYHNYQMKIGRLRDRTLYNTLFDVLSEPVPSHKIELPNDHIEFDAYVSSIQDEVVHVYDDEQAYYKNLTCNITAMIPRRRATS